MPSQFPLIPALPAPFDGALRILGGLDPATQFHLCAACVALLLGPFAIYRRRRDRVHKVCGWVWVLAMAALAGSGFLLHGIRLWGPFSPIHLLSVLTLWYLWRGVRAAIRRDIALHSRIMAQLYWRAAIGAGLFTLWPGRTLNRMLFGDTPQLAWVVIGLGVLALIALGWSGKDRGARFS